MFAPFVKETASAPGTSTTINLAGTAVPFQSFTTAGFTNGSTIDGYILRDSGQAEWGWGTFNTGSPNTLSRTTVVGNTAGTTARLNFAGTTEVYCWPIKTLAATGAGTVDAFLADIRNLGSVNGGAIGGFRNRILNPKFEVWQGGSSLSGLASEADIADGWHFSHDGSGATVNALQGDALLYLSDSVLNAGNRNYCSIQATVAGTGGTYRQLKSFVENVGTLASKTVVVGAWARADTSRNMTVLLAQKMGTGGSPSSDVSTSVGTWALTSSWQWFQGSTTLPSISGKTLGSSGNNSLWLVFGLPLNTTLTVELADVQLMEGTTLPYAMAEPRTYAEALRRCQRYRTKIPLGLVGAASSSTTVSIAGRLPVPMFTTPSVTWSGTGTISVPGTGPYTSSTAPTVNFYDAITGAIGLTWGGFTGLSTNAPVIYTTAPTTGLLTSTLF